MKKVGNFLKNIIVFLNDRVNLTLILILSLLMHWLILYFFKFDESLIKWISFYIHPVTLGAFFISYACYMIEIMKRTYENRRSKIRLIGNLLQIPNLMLAGASLSIIFAQIFYNAIGDGTFFYFFSNLVMVIVCAFANFMLNYANERDLKGFIRHRKKKEPLNFE